MQMLKRQRPINKLAHFLFIFCSFFYLYQFPILRWLLLLWSGVVDKRLKNSEDFVWAIETPLAGKFIINVDFINLKTADPNVRLCFFSILSAYNLFSLWCIGEFIFSKSYLELITQPQSLTTDQASKVYKSPSWTPGLLLHFWSKCGCC